MAPDTSNPFDNHLIKANRALIALDTMDKRQRDASASKELHNCLSIYTDLLMFQHNAGLTPAQSEQLQSVLDRVRAHLRFFGEDV